MDWKKQTSIKINLIRSNNIRIGLCDTIKQTNRQKMWEKKKKKKKS